MKCLDEKALSSYLDKRLSDTEREGIEEHIAGCNACLDMLLVAYESQNKKCPEVLREKIKNIMRREQACLFPTAPKKKRPGLKWLLAALVFFGLSFIFRSYFLQFLAAAIILGFKWVMEGEGAKRVIMIFKGIQEKEKKFERKSPPDVSNIVGGDKYGEPGKRS